MLGDQFPSARSYEPLSQRERDILGLLAENLSNREIADRLVIAYTTVKWYNQQIFNKLGVENRQQAVERALAVGLLAPTSAQPSSRDLPAQITPFVSRVAELDHLTRLIIHSNTRFVTILAPGGMGKTRLALATAETARRHFAEGVYFVPLAPLTSPDQLVPAIAEYLGLQSAPDRRTPKQQLLDFLRARRALLILDSFEHLLDGASLVIDLLHAAPNLKVIVTSRQRLHLDGETIYRLDGMPYPEATGDEHALDYGAVQLFLECARRAYPHFVDYDLGSIVRICQLVEGMPLAIELAAAWVGTLAPAEIANEIVHSTDFLRTTLRNVPERMRSIRAVFEATWRRLTADEQQAFCRISVFRGGCTREAAREVGGATLGTLAGLVDKALVWYRPERGRYEIHDLLRQYAAEQLEADGESEATRDLHRDYYGTLARGWGKALKTPKQLQALDVLEADYDNVREAFQRAIESAKPEVIEPFTDLWYFYEIRSRYLEAEPLFRRAIEKLHGQENVALGKLLAGQTLILERLDAHEQARLYGQKSLDMLRRVGAESETSLPLMVLGAVWQWFGDLERQAALYREGFEVARRFGDPWATARFLFLLGESAHIANQVDEAARLFSEANILAQKQGNHWLAGFALRDLGRLALFAGDYDKAQPLYEASVANARKINHLINICNGLGGLYWVARAQGNNPLAKRHNDEMLKIALDWGSSFMLFETRLQVADVAIACGDYAEAKQQLREALNLFSRMNDRNSIVFLSAVAACFAAGINAKAQALVLAGFVDHNLRHILWARLLCENLQQLKVQMQSELPSYVFDAAWEQGQTLNDDDALARLRDLI